MQNRRRSREAELVVLAQVHLGFYGRWHVQELIAKKRIDLAQAYMIGATDYLLYYRRIGENAARELYLEMGLSAPEAEEKILMAKSYE